MAAPPNDIRWYRRCVLLDRETGKIYAHNVAEKSDKLLNEPHPFVSWERQSNQFTVMGSSR